jgi:PAS domain S-box-containing protein
LLGKARRAEERYDALFESSNDTITVLTLDGIILEANHRWQDLLGFPAEHLVGKHVRDFAPPGQEEENFGGFLRSLKDGGQRTVVPIKRTDGTIVQMEFSPTVVAFDGRPVAFVVGHDITERVRAARALEEVKETYRSIVERIPDVVWTMDQHEKLVFITPNVAQVCGYTAEEMYGEDAEARSERCHPENRELVREAFAALLHDGKPFDFEYRRLCKDGTWVWLRNRGVVAFERQGGQ